MYVDEADAGPVYIVEICLLNRERRLWNECGINITAGGGLMTSILSVNLHGVTNVLQMRRRRTMSMSLADNRIGLCVRALELDTGDRAHVGARMLESATGTLFRAKVAALRMDCLMRK